MTLPTFNNTSNDAVVTVIVPAYNHARYLVDALDSVRDQTFQRWKLIVIDDGSTDQTWSILNEYSTRIADPRIKIIRQENKGSQVTINRGLSMADTPYLAILNSKDNYHPDRLEYLINQAKSLGGDVFIVTGIDLIDENGQPIQQDYLWHAMYVDIVNQWNSNIKKQMKFAAADALLSGNSTLTTSNFFMSRGVWKQAGLLKSYKYVPDWDYALRVAFMLPGQFHFFPERRTLSYRVHRQDMILSEVLRNHLEAARVMRTFQKAWSAMGQTVPVHAIDRLHDLNRLMRHEHTRLVLEKQKRSWIEKVQALKIELDRSISSHLESQSQLEHWHHEAQQWHQLADQMRSSWSWRLTAPLRYGMGQLKKIRSKVKQGLTNAKDNVQHWAAHPVDPYQLWLKNESFALERQKVQAPIDVHGMSFKPFFSVVMPVYNTPTAFLRSAVASVQSQWYANWELCICNDASDDSAVQLVLDELKEADSRIKCIQRKVPGHIVLATNDAMSIAQGDYVVFLDHDDLLAPQALYAFAQQLNHNADTDLIYSDEDKIDSNGQRCLPFFKPDWSPALLWSQNYIGHLMCVRRQRLVELGGLQAGTQGSQDHDLVLRLAHKHAKIAHLPGVLYHWRLHSESTSVNAAAKPYAHQAGKEAVSRHLALRYRDQFDRVDDSDFPFVYLPRFKVPADTLASIIIPTRDRVDLLQPCIESIQKKSTGIAFEIIILDNCSEEARTADYFKVVESNSGIKVIDAPIQFNWSRLNNMGRQHAKGQLLVFLNNDTVVISEDWLQRLAEYALLPDVATVGPLLLYPDNTVQHAGVVVGMGHWADHVFKGQRPVHYPSPFVSCMVPRNVMANTGACTAIATARFDQLGGFDEAFQICGSDVELGIRAYQQGYMNVYLPTTQLYHHESKTRTSHVPEVDFQQSARKYAPFRTEGDPFYNPNLDILQTTPTPGAYHLVQNPRSR